MTMMRRTGAWGLALAALLLAAGPAGASDGVRATPSVRHQEASPKPTASAPASAPRTSRAGDGQDGLAKGRGKDDQDIAARLETLGWLGSLVGADRYLSAADRSQLSGEISGEIAGLTQLKAKIDADGSADALRGDTEDIYGGFRVYAVERPKVDLVRGSDDLLWQCSNRLHDLPGQVSALLAKLPAASPVPAQAQPLLADAQRQIATACADAQAAHDEVIGLTPGGYPGNQPAIDEARAKLKAARDALRQL